MRPLPYLLTALGLCVAACASSAPPAPDPTPTPAPQAQHAPAAPQKPTQARGEVVAMSGESVSEGERLELAAQDYRRALESMFKNLQGELDRCYLPALKRDPDLRGAVTVKFQVREGGKIGQEGPQIADSTLRSELVERCLLELIAAQQYPEPFNGEYTDVQRVFHFGEF